MRQTFLRRGLIAVLGFAALVFATLGTQPATPVGAADVFSNVGCTFGDYSCLYARSGYNNVYGTYGYPTVYQPSWTNYPPYWGNYTFSQPAVPYTYAYTTTYAPVNYSYYSSPYYSYPYYGNAFYGYQGYSYAPGYGYVPSAFFTRVGCPVGNFSCVRGR